MNKKLDKVKKAVREDETNHLSVIHYNASKTYIEIYSIDITSLSVDVEHSKIQGYKEWIGNNKQCSCTLATS